MIGQGGRACAVASSNRALDLQVTPLRVRSVVLTAAWGREPSLTSQSPSSCEEGEELIGRQRGRKEADLIGRLRGEFEASKSLHRPAPAYRPRVGVRERQTQPRGTVARADFHGRRSPNSLSQLHTTQSHTIRSLSPYDTVEKELIEGVYSSKESRSRERVESLLCRTAR